MKKKSKIKLKKAYKNEEFLTSREARVIRILAEYLEPETRFEKFNVKDTIVFFGSARIISEKEALKRLKALEKRKRTKKVDVLLDEARKDLVFSKYYEAARELAKKITEWSKEIHNEEHRFIVCSGGGPGIMEAANRGASEAGGVSIGLNISLPFEQEPNPYITRELAFEFHYFFMRKFWFVYLAKAIIVFPGGFGTMDEFFELITLIQTKKIDKYVPIVLFGKEYWDEILNFEALVKWGTISEEDLELFKFFDSVDEAFSYIKEELTREYLK